MKPKIIVKAGVPKGYMEPEEPERWHNGVEKTVALQERERQEWEAAKAAAIAEAKEFEDEGRIKKLLHDSLCSIPDCKLPIDIADGTYDSPIGWVEVTQLKTVSGKWVDAYGGTIPECELENPVNEYRKILRLVEKEGGMDTPEKKKQKEHLIAMMNETDYDLGAGQEKEPQDGMAAIKEIAEIRNTLMMNFGPEGCPEPLINSTISTHEMVYSVILKLQALIQEKGRLAEKDNDPEAWLENRPEMTKEQILTEAIDYPQINGADVREWEHGENVLEAMEIYANNKNQELRGIINTLLDEFKKCAEDGNYFSRTVRYTENCHRYEQPQSQENQPDETQELWDEILKFLSSIGPIGSGFTLAKDALANKYTIKRK